MREPYSLAVRQLPSLPLLCPELEEFPCAEPDQTRRARCLSSQFGIARVLLICACDECTSKTAGGLYQICACGECTSTLFGKAVSCLGTDPLDPCTLFTKAVSEFPRVTPENSHDSIVENQPENVRKAAGARQHLSDDTDVDQCTGCTVKLLYVVCFQVGRLYAQCWKCFNVWPFLGRINV